jgi:hypothetical protein
MIRRRNRIWHPATSLHKPDSDQPLDDIQPGGHIQDKLPTKYKILVYKSLVLPNTLHQFGIIMKKPQHELAQVTKIWQGYNQT